MQVVAHLAGVRDRRLFGGTAFFVEGGFLGADRLLRFVALQHLVIVQPGGGLQLQAGIASDPPLLAAAAASFAGLPKALAAPCDIAFGVRLGGRLDDDLPALAAQRGEALSEAIAADGRAAGKQVAQGPLCNSGDLLLLATSGAMPSHTEWRARVRAT